MSPKYKVNTHTLTKAAVTRASKPFSTMVVTELTNHSWGSLRFDVVAVTPNAKFIKMIEVKLTRADFRRGLSEGQFDGYMPFCHQLFIAAPAGVIDKEEVPTGVGLLELYESGVFRATKRAARREMTPAKYQQVLGRVLQKIIVGAEEVRVGKLRAQWEHRSSFRQWLRSTELSRQDIKE